MGNKRVKIQRSPKKNGSLENQRKKIPKQLLKNDRETIPVLPREILESILRKLLDAVDLIRFRAVCKNWNIDIPQDIMIRYKRLRNQLPWLCNLSWAKDHYNRLQCEIYDPYSRQVFRTWKLGEGCRYTRSYSNIIEVIGSGRGWLIGHYYHYSMFKEEIFMYNPYRNDFIALPCMWEYRPRFATFSGNPVSHNCRVFVFSENIFSQITSYGLNEDIKEWRIDFVDAKQMDCCGMQYMNEQLFCLFKDGAMRRYNLVDRSWTQLVLGEGSHIFSVFNQRLWLAKGEGDILVGCELDGGGAYSAFYFDWSKTSWIGISDLCDSSAIFISGSVVVGGVATFVRQLEDYDDDDDDDGENMMDCKVYCFNELAGTRHPSYYTFTETRKQHLEYYYSTEFIEPPPIN